MHPLNKMFEKVYCLNLLERTDRRENIEKRFKNLGIEVEFVEGVKHGWMKGFSNFDFIPSNAISVTIDHYNVIKKAQLKNYNNIFIFEDDTTFIKDFNDLIERYLENAPENWNLLYLYLRTEGLYIPKKVNDYWVKAQGACVSAYGINKNFYKVFLYEMDQRFGVIDEVAGRFHNTGQKNNIAFYNCYCTYPNLCLQDYNIGSNIVGGQNLEQMEKTTTNMWGKTFNDYE